MPSGEATRVENRFHGFRCRKNACGCELVLLCDTDDPLHGVGAPLGGNGRGLVKMTPRSGRPSPGSLPRVRHEQQIRIRMLHLGQTLRGPHHALQAFLIQLIGGCPGRAATEHRAHRDHGIFLGHVLMNRVVGKAG